MTPIPLTDTSRPPQFPCWLYAHGKWLHCFGDFPDCFVMRSEITHWHSDQPDAPKERPGEVDTTLADEVRAECSKMTPEQRKQAHEHGMKMINQSSDNRQAESGNRQSDTPRTDRIALAGLDEDIYIAKMTDLARKLKRELRALEQELAATKTLLEAQLKFQRELRADRDRLDWLEENCSYSGGGHGGTYSFSTPLDVECGMLRAAIDAAMQKQEGGK